MVEIRMEMQCTVRRNIILPFPFFISSSHPSCFILEYSIHLLPLIPLQQFLPQFPLISPILFHFLLSPTFPTKSTLSISLHLSFSNHIFFSSIMTSTGTDFGMQGLISIVNDIQEVFSIIGILSFYA